MEECRVIAIPAGVAIALPIVLGTLLVVLLVDELIEAYARRVVAKECV